VLRELLLGFRKVKSGVRHDYLVVEGNDKSVKIGVSGSGLKILRISVGLSSGHCKHEMLVRFEGFRLNSVFRPKLEDIGFGI